MKLYEFKAAPNPRRVRIFLAEKGIDVPTVQIDLQNREQHTPEFLARNPMGGVPCLELDDGSHISESVAICRYFEGLQPEPRLMGAMPEEAARIEMWNRRMELVGMAAAGEAFRNSVPAFADRALPGVDPVAQIPDLAQRGLERLPRFYERLDEGLAKTPYVAGESYSIADITALVAIDFAGWIKIQPDESLVNIADWYGRVSSRPSASA
ncbi:MAG TPA: glutathione S-transferase [Alphaproteobacteria bacterium]|jgi:glutathione S-transferase|nr:glutathione S-transferase [Alphaproteobacteria bacterium]